jgi:hypothetical protein
MLYDQDEETLRDVMMALKTKPERYEDPEEMFRDLLTLHKTERKTAATRRHYSQLFERTADLLGLEFGDLAALLELAREKERSNA